MSNFVYKGFPSIFGNQNSSGKKFISTDSSFSNNSTSVVVVGNSTSDVLSPSTGRQLIIKGITIVGGGNAGTVKLYRDSNDSVILPVYVSLHGRQSTSGALNLVLNVDEKVYVTTASRGENDETFVGISYMEI